jgi:hypothetical protein
MSKFQRKIYNTVSGTTLMVDADVAVCEYCDKVATATKPIADCYGEYADDVLVCDTHNPNNHDITQTVREVSEDELKANLDLMERGFIL